MQPVDPSVITFAACVERMKVNCILAVVSGVYYGAVSTAASLHLSLNAASTSQARCSPQEIELLRPAACGRSVRWRRRRQKKDRTEWQVPFTRQKSDPGRNGRETSPHLKTYSPSATAARPPASWDTTAPCAPRARTTRSRRRASTVPRPRRRSGGPPYHTPCTSPHQTI